MSATTAEYAYLSQAAFANSGWLEDVKLPGWQAHTLSDLGYIPQNSSFSAVVYSNSASGEWVIVYRGADENLYEGAISNVALHQELSDAYNLYLRVLDENPTNMTLTGQSFGGWMAAAISAITGDRAVVFSPVDYSTVVRQCVSLFWLRRLYY